MATRLGVDVGGTFTDLIFYDEETGEVRVGKESTTPASPDIGITKVVGDAVGPERLARTQYFLHGTTVGLNALLERRGARVGLLATAGFRDVLAMRRGDRSSMYDVQWVPPEPLVPRRLRLPVRGRIRADGAIETPFEEEDVAAAVEAFRAAEVESVAVAFINACANPAHELAARDALIKHGFEGEISLSHQVSGEYREYERTSTTVIDAYVRPRMAAYLRKLETSLSDGGFSGSCLITRVGGGAMSFAEGEARPFETVTSGPVAGAVGAGELCRALGIDQAITADVGGTSFDTCLISNGRPTVKYEGEIVDMPLQTPWVDVRSIGAGGGSIAYVDVGGLLRVGPRSAGAVPGPVCYGRGGTEPTVTDAAAHLGMLAFGELGGGVTLDFAGAEAALTRLGDTLGLDADATACGILTIANAAMANAIRSVTVEQGQDPRAAVLLPFGGAGPLFGTLLAQELDIARSIVPMYAGNFSAWGLLGQDLTRSAALTMIRPLDEAGVQAANEILATLFAELAERGSGADGDAVELVPALDLRYHGQEYTLTVELPGADGRITATPEQIAATFSQEYERAFGHMLSGPVEIVNVRANARTPLPRRSHASAAAPSGSAPAAERTLDAYSFTRGERVPFRVVDRDALPAGEPVEGPMIITEQTTTTYVDAGFELVALDSGALELRNLAVAA